MPRDDFSEPTKRTLAQRAGGRCSRPGCDRLCWLPGTEPDAAATIGVAAHICAASPGGPRYDSTQTAETRSAIENAIYLCRNCSTEIDVDPGRFEATTLREWKERHEEQIRNTSSGRHLFPSISLQRQVGITISGEAACRVTARDIGNRVEHVLILRNDTDYEYRRIGFSVTYPEMIEHPPLITAPPGCNTQLYGENMEFQVSVEGTGLVELPQTTHYGSFTLEAGSLLPRQEIRIIMRSVRDPYPQPPGDKIPYHVCGELMVMRGSLIETQGFTSPFLYNAETRAVSVGELHDSCDRQDEYVTVYRA